ncbi:MAG: Aminodeoxychorismate lyase (EC [uncultured Aureispira sp.]|uniref:branched-chain-amino-acid transaminase n=1 Tax=uncultured Aureispira sp. TaxID=1331704 RepID=A0A6S6U1W1_9BACT|nr:MAG: Aminodeoxychorismate lyase (EC [uncultured Aureispira sp.]
MYLNRAFKYGDGLFETIRVRNGEVLFLESHFTRLSRGLTILHMQDSKKPLSIEKFQEILQDFLSKQSDANLRIRITFFRQGDGLYTPKESSYAYYIESSTLESPSFALNEKGLYLGRCSAVQLPIDQLSNLKTTSALPYVLAALEKKEKGWEDCFILNSAGAIAESIAANVFLCKGKQVFTPALNQGCIAGVMRQNVLELIQELDLEPCEGVVLWEDVQQADEIWLSNAIRGIQWVKQVVGCSTLFENSKAKQVINRLNQRIKPKY